MSDKGKTQLTILITATPDLVDEGDRIFELHERWIGESHAREGDKALLSYNVAKGPERANALDPSSEPTGNTTYVLTEVYETPAGVDDHWQQSGGWEHIGDLLAWAGKCQVTTLHGSPVVHSHW
jgi:hypothetical protein